MARPTQGTPVKERPGHALTAAALTYPGKATEETSVTKTPHSTEPWQRDVWAMYGVVPELGYAVNWSANVSSRAALKVMLRDPQTNVMSDAPGNHRAWALLDELTGGRDKQSEFIRQTILHFKVAGECSWVSRAAIKADGPTAMSKGKLWEIVGTEEIRYDGKQWWIDYEGSTPLALEESDVVIRAWVPHPMNRRLADSAAGRALDVMREIRGYDFHIKAQQVSRLTGNGITFVPDSMTVKAPAGVNPALTSAEIVTETLMKVAAINIETPGVAAAQVPLFATARAEDISAVKHLTFWSPLDEKAHDMRVGSITRLATGLDTPKEVVTGTGDMNRWGAWQVDESAVKAHIEPDLSTCAMLITTEYIQPALRDPNVVIVADTSTLRLRPNRSKEAIELYDRGELSAKALRRETGFNEDDAPTPDERTLWITMQMLRASWFPEQAQVAAESLGVKLPFPDLRDNNGREARPIPSLKGHPTRDIPTDDVEESGPARVASGAPLVPDGAMSAAAATLAFRGMERAGNRLRTASGKRPDIDRENTHTVVKVYPDKVDELLEGSFDCHARLGLPPEIVERVSDYCTDLLLTSEPFDFGKAIERIGAP